jgi:glycine/D-amino acid oxidase-like deaminating enzyme
MTDQTAYGGSWYAAGVAASPPRAPLTVEADVDVCVIGGGLAGLTAAREIARRGWSVALLEGNRIAWNASGRNTGFVLPGFAADPEPIIKRVGLDRAKALWALSEAGVGYVRDTAKQMPGTDIEEHGWLHVSKTGNGTAMAEQARLLSEDFGASVEAWPAERVRTELRSTHYFEAIHYRDAFTINPLNYALGLAAAAEAAGARIFERTPALEIDPAGVRKRITTPSARIRASQVVLAGNVQLDALMPKIAATLVPVWTYVIVTAPLGPRLQEAIRYRGAVSDTELADNHYRVVGGDRLMWGGRCTMWSGNPKSYIRTLLADIRRVFPQLGDVQAEYAWAGVLGNTVHCMPQIGELSPGLWLLSGFGGHGLNTTAMGGNLVARAIVDGEQTWRLFSPFELVWAGGRIGRAVAQAYYWYFRTRERLEGLLARRDEAKRMRPAVAAPVPAAEIAPTPEPVVASQSDAMLAVVSEPHAVPSVSDAAPESAPSVVPAEAAPAEPAEELQPTKKWSRKKKAEAAKPEAT